MAKFPIYKETLCLTILLSTVCFRSVQSWDGWRTGRATFYGGLGDPWTIHYGSCGYYYLHKDVGTGWDIAALSDKCDDYYNSCGRCYEVMCDDTDLKDGYGEHLNRKGICINPGKSVIVQVTDSCQCYYPDNGYSNKRWCCGDMYHMDLSVWAFEKLADVKWGVMAIKFRPVDCGAVKWQNNKAYAPKPSPGYEAPSGWQSSWDKRPNWK